MSVADQIRKLQMKGSAELRQRAVREAKREKDRFAAKAGGTVSGIRMDPTFAQKLQRKAAEARERQGKPARGDLPEVIDQLRLEGKLPPAADDATRVGYEPTADEILADLTETELPLAVPEKTDPSPDAETVLSLSGKPILPGALSAEEILEIDKLNPSAGKRSPSKQTLPRGKRR